MKTLKINSFIGILFFIIVSALSLTSCQANKKADVKSENTTAQTTLDTPEMDLHTAVITGNLDIVKQHIKAGSDLNVIEPMGGSSPLISAATFNKPEIAAALINANADLSIKNNDGSTALHTAAFFGRVEIVQLLIDAKADKTLKNNFGATARETVLGDFAQVKPIYEMLTLQLKPLGFTLDLEAVKKARPVIATMLQ